MTHQALLPLEFAALVAWKDLVNLIRTESEHERFCSRKNCAHYHVHFVDFNKKKFDERTLRGEFPDQYDLLKQ